MQVFKCKMCGGTLNIESGTTVAKCEFCGRTQTIPNLDDQKRANLYDRANHFRRNNDYDKAMDIYELILNEDKTDAEAYWSILLCKYGIEYVEDPITHKRVPTINRTQLTSILSDEDYKAAIRYADGYQKDVYETEAKEIDSILKGVLEISSKEEPFDVFICYKETDKNGNRTVDSVLAQELYYGLKKEGFKAFFSKITLENKLGTVYEPYIFAALNSAKVMVVLGSKLEHFNAVWVKNEWSRYLSLIKSGKNKTLIPAFKDMDPYDLPEEFLHLQALDMNKLGFMQDLIHGIKKIIGRPETTKTESETVKIENVVQDVAPLLRRVYMFIDEGDYDSADRYTEKVLDLNPECAEAYFVKILAKLRVPNVETLIQRKIDISENLFFKKALRFADEKYKKILIGYSDAILNSIDTAKKESIYQSAVEAFNGRRYLEAMEIFSTIADFKDSSDKIKEGKEKLEIERKERIYNKVLSLVVRLNYANETELKESIKALQSISGYKDADQKAEELQARLEQLYIELKEAERLKEQRENERKERRKEILSAVKKWTKICLPIAVSIIIVVVLVINLFIPMSKYGKANDLLNHGEYEQATQIYQDLDGFSGSETKLAVIEAVKKIENSNYEQGITSALLAGAEVNLTYEFDGGYFAQSTMKSGTKPMSIVAFSEQNLTEKTYKFTKIEEFTGIKTPVRNGYDFIGWGLSSCKANVNRKDNQVNVRLVATWEMKEFVITYSLGGGTVTEQNPISYNSFDQTITLNNPTKKGYTFIGWTGTGLTEKTMTVTIPTGSSGVRNYYANWKGNSYTVTYDANGGTASKTEDVATSGTYFVLATVSERTGYKFNGWKLEDKTYKNGTWETYESVTLVADWELIRYSISYNLNGGDSTNVTSYTVADTVSLTEPTKAGYTFKGWTWVGNNTPSKAVTFNNETGDKSFFASWTANTDTPYKVEYYFENVNDSNYSIDNSLTINKQGTTDTPSETAEIKTFEHFSFNEEISVVESNISGDGLTVLKVYYKRNVYTLSVDNASGGIITNSGSYKYDESKSITTSMIRYMGYNFAGWYNGEELLSTDSDYTFTLDKNVTAVFEVQPEMIAYNFTSTTTTCEVTGVKNPLLTEFVIPEDVTSIVSRIFPGKMTSLKIYGDIKTIADKQFYNYTSLTTLELPNSLVSIGYEAFSYCSSLTSVKIPNNVTKIYSRAFRCCYDLQDVTFEENSRLEFIGDEVFLNCHSLQGIEIPNSVTIIGYSAFEFCYALKSATIPNNLRSFGTSVFKNTGLTHVEIPSCLTSINNSTFSGCSSLETVVIPKSITSIAESAFFNTGLTSIEIPSSVTSIGDSAFGWCWELSSVIIPSSVTSIGASAFYDCYALTSIEIPSSVTIIGNSVFNSCYKLSKIIIPNSVISIGRYAFSSCSSLESIELPDSITTIDDYAFRSCSNLQTIKLPSNLNSMGDEIFKYCYALTSIDIPEGVTSINYDSFSDCKALKSVTIPTTVTYIGSSAFSGCISLQELKYNAIRCTIGSNLFDEIGDEGQEIKLIVGKDVLEIPDKLFYFYNNELDVKLTEVIFEENSVCERIGDYAFASCRSLKKVYIPKSVISVGQYIFNHSRDVIVYCEAESKPSTWEYNLGATIVWDYKNQQIVTE